MDTYGFFVWRKVCLRSNEMSNANCIDRWQKHGNNNLMKRYLRFRMPSLLSPSSSCLIYLEQRTLAFLPTSKLHIGHIKD